ncbi:MULTISPECIES: DUF192 domain-containing protein [Streptomyces]|uniref:DUF192 domain-containing protein n=1 Tax=Streptomyces TaxID=1883 RepID=UPI0013169D7A|nr:MULTISPECIES: DUF192 domain-containing protein [Streptomyces]QGZ50711.1 DUF192 domain-containing protein [Streptomyces sp. QHH-9511]GGT83198.1 hypothetical protein GCM10010272_29810 [Streptomyces lateritius]
MGKTGSAGGPGGAGSRGSAGRWRDGTGALAVPEGAVDLEIAASYRARRRGLLGRDGITGALLITPTNSVHTFGMRFTIDVAYLDRHFTVLDVVTMKPGRLGMIRPRGRHVLEAEGGAMAGWGLRPGVRVTAVPDRAA